jgi:uncharacterized repeat protein (TIGR01451 family)
MITEKGYTSPFLSTGTHYIIVTPPVVYAGQNFWITVVVVDQTNSSKTDYCGTTSFTATDPAAKIESAAMDTYNYTWSSNVGVCGGAPYDNGVKMFYYVTFNRIGQQSLVAVDTSDGSITGLAAFMVVGVDVKLTKEPRLAVQASGDMFQFKICWSNYSSASAFTFTITDAVPVGTSYVPEVATNMDCGNTDGVTLKVAYSTSTLTPAPTSSYVEISGTAAADAQSHWLKWTVPVVGVQTTGCACFRVTIN